MVPLSASAQLFAFFVRLFATFRLASGRAICEVSPISTSFFRACRTSGLPPLLHAPTHFGQLYIMDLIGRGRGAQIDAGSRFTEGFLVD